MTLGSNKEEMFTDVFGDENTVVHRDFVHFCVCTVLSKCSCAERRHTYFRDSVMTSSPDVLASKLDGLFMSQEKLLLHHHLLPLKLLTAGYMYITLCSISVRQRAAGLMALYWNGRSRASSFGYILRALQKNL